MDEIKSNFEAFSKCIMEPWYEAINEPARDMIIMFSPVYCHQIIRVFRIPSQSVETTQRKVAHIWSLKPVAKELEIVGVWTFQVG